jgi:hypothetical protein
MTGPGSWGRERYIHTLQVFLVRALTLINYVLNVLKYQLDEFYPFFTLNVKLNFYLWSQRWPRGPILWFFYSKHCPILQKLYPNLYPILVSKKVAIFPPELAENGDHNVDPRSLSPTSDRQGFGNQHIFRPSDPAKRENSAKFDHFRWDLIMKYLKPPESISCTATDESFGRNFRPKD